MIYFKSKNNIITYKIDNKSFYKQFSIIEKLIHTNFGDEVIKIEISSLNKETYKKLSTIINKGSWFSISKVLNNNLYLYVIDIKNINL